MYTSGKYQFGIYIYIYIYYATFLHFVWILQNIVTPTQPNPVIGNF